MTELDEIGKALAQITTEYAKLSWTHYTTGYDFGIREAQKKIDDFKKDADHYKQVVKYLERNSSPDERRQSEILYKNFAPYHRGDKANKILEQINSITLKLKSILNSFRYSVDGRTCNSAEIAQILSSSDNQKLRQKAYLSRNQINSSLIDAGFLNLVQLRKDYAQECGYSDFVEFKLDHSDLTRDLFTGWREDCASLQSQFSSIAQQFADKYHEGSPIRPWDRSYIGQKISSARERQVDIFSFKSPIARVFSKFGFEVDRYDITYDIFPREHKSEWGYNFCIAPGVESRILCNADARLRSFGVLLHETAHAVHFGMLKPEDYVFNMAVPGIVAEGFANLFGDLSYSEFFLSYFFQDEAKSLATELSEFELFLKLGSLSYIPSILFDHSLYLEEIHSYDQLVQSFWENYSLIGEEPYADEPIWGSTIHFTSHPIYMHNYLVGDIMRAAIEKTFLEKTQSSSIWQNPESFGEFLRDKILLPSGRSSFLQLYEQVCGGTPNLKDYYQSIFTS